MASLSLSPTSSLALITAASILLSACAEPAHADPTTSSTIRVEAVELTLAASEESVLLHGAIEGGESSPLAFLVGGRLIERRVDVGDRVQAGQVLARLDAAGYRNGVRAAESTLSRARAQRDQQNREDARAASLVGNGAISVQRAESAMSGAQAAEAGANAAAADLREHRRQLRESVLRASTDGVITEAFIDRGTVVSAGQPIFAFAADEGRGVWVEASLETGRHIELGDVVSVELNSSGSRVDARVDRLSPVLSARGLVPIHLVIDAEASPVIGEGVIAHFSVRTASERLSVAIGAVVDPTGGHPFLWRIDENERVHRAPIEVLGMGHAGRVLLRPRVEDGDTAALHEGTRIVVAGRALLLEGDEVIATNQASHALASQSELER